MKLAVTIFLLLAFCDAYGQKWHLNRVNETAALKYEYWLQFDNKEDTSSFILENKAGQSIPSINVHNNNGDTIDFAIIKITNLNSGIEYEFLSEAFGKLNLKPGNYNIMVSAIGYDRFSVNLKLIRNQSFDLNLKLGLSESGYYQINSLEKLSDREMSVIINCIKNNEPVYYNKCSKINKYHVTRHI